jgi:ribosome production factor 1
MEQKESKKARERRRKEDAKAEALGKTPVKRIPKTLENTREDDVTFVKAGDEDIAIEEDQDEFAAHFNSERPPHVLLTTCYKCTSIMYKFCADLMVRFRRIFLSPNRMSPTGLKILQVGETKIVQHCKG